jgi:arginine exporter protein ArgO
MLNSLLSGVVAGFGIAIPVGAIGVLLIGLAARTSLRIGAAAGFGTATADGLYALAAVLGGTALTGLIRPIATPMRWIAAAVLIVLAARTLASAVAAHRDPGHGRGRSRSDAVWSSPARAYAALVGLTILNPATVIYFAALVLGSQSGRSHGVAAGALFVLGAFAASASWQLLLACGGALLGRTLAGPRGRLATAITSSFVIAALAVHVLLP